MPAGGRLGAVADHVDGPALADPEDGPDLDRIKKRVTDRVFIGSGVYSLGDVVEDAARDLDLCLGGVSGGFWGVNFATPAWDRKRESVFLLSKKRSLNYIPSDETVRYAIKCKTDRWYRPRNRRSYEHRCRRARAGC